MNAAFNSMAAAARCGFLPKKPARRLCTHNEYFHELELLQNALTGQLTEWRKPNEDLRRLCCIT
jgi:hypothetical protein